MARNLFSVPIFFIVFRETVEAAIIVSVLLSFVEQLMTTGRFGQASPGAKIPPPPSTPPQHELGYTQTASQGAGLDSGVGPSIGLVTADELATGSKTAAEPETPAEEQAELERASLVGDSERVRRILKRMKVQIWAGTLIGFFIALCIGAAFIAVFYTKLTDLWANTEQIWEGVFSLVAAFIIYLMGIAFLKMDRSRVKWRIKLSDAFDDRIGGALKLPNGDAEAAQKSRWWKRNKGPKRARGGKWALFLLPFITVLREGLEAVVFVGGVSLGQPAASIPIAVIAGLIAGGLVGYLIYRTGSSFALHWFLVVSTCILFLIGAGLFSKGAAFFEVYHFVKGVGADITESGAGPGSYQVQGNIYHLLYGNPETGAVGTNGGWQIFNAILGWNNNGTYASILCYVFYWVAVMLALVWYKFSEGRVTFCGISSEAYKRRQRVREGRERQHESKEVLADRASGSDASSPMTEKKEGNAMRGEETYHTLE